MAESFEVTIAAGQNLSDCCADGDGKHVVSNVLLVRGETDNQPYAIATNGKIMAVAVLAGEVPDKPTLLPAEACRANGRDATLRIGDECRVISGKKTTIHEMPEQKGSFPQARSLFEAFFEGEKKYCTVKLDAQYLAALAKAISSDSTVSLIIPLPEKRGASVTAPLAVVGGTCFKVSTTMLTGVGMICPLSENSKDETILAKALQRLKDFAEQLPSEKIRLGESKGKSDA